MSFQVVSADVIPPVATRTSKTTPLREAMAALQIGEAIELAYSVVNGEEIEVEGGFRPTTISQVCGTMSRRCPDKSFSVRTKQDKSGCFIIAIEKPELDETEDGTDAPKRGRKAKAAAEAVEPAAA